MLETVGDGVFLVDDTGIVRLWNRAAESITGSSRERIVGRRLEEVLPGWERVTARAETLPLELAGRERWVSVSGVTFDEGTVYAFRDITEERVLEEIRQDLVATVSHELRTPLAAIYGSAMTLNRDDLELEPGVDATLLNVIVEESARLGHIVDDLLLASQLDAGRLDVHIESCDAGALAVEMEASALFYLAAANGVQAACLGVVVDVDTGEANQEHTYLSPEELNAAVERMIDVALGADFG